MGVLIVVSLEVIDIVQQDSETLGCLVPEVAQEFGEGTHVQKSGLHVAVSRFYEIGLKACASEGNLPEYGVSCNAADTYDDVSDEDIGS